MYAALEVRPEELRFCNSPPEPSSGVDMVSLEVRLQPAKAGIQK
jgi:hypothetical protein